MPTTSLSLLERLKAGPDPDAWERVERLYRPLIRTWVARVPGMVGHADDLAQDVLTVLFQEVSAFERRREGSFRAWLRAVTVNRVRAHCRKRRPMASGGDATDDFLARLEDPRADLSRVWDAEHDRHVFGVLLTTVEADFQPATWKAFRMVTFDGLSAAEAAGRLGLSENAVLLAKSHVLKRLRAEASGLID